MGPPSTKVMDAIGADPVVFQPVWDAIMAGKSLTCTRTGKQCPGVPAPSFVLLDVHVPVGKPLAFSSPVYRDFNTHTFLSFAQTLLHLLL